MESKTEIVEETQPIEDTQPALEEAPAEPEPKRVKPDNKDAFVFSTLAVVGISESTEVRTLLEDVYEKLMKIKGDSE